MTKQQEKCNCECHKTSGSVCGICYGKRCSISVTNAPSPHQEGWEKHNWYKTIREIAKSAGYEPNAWFEDQMEKAIRHGISEAILSIRSADIAAFKEMIKKTSGLEWGVAGESPTPIWKNEKELTQKLQEYDRGTK